MATVTMKDFTYKKLMGGWEVYRPIADGKIPLGYISYNEEKDRWEGEGMKGERVSALTKARVSKLLLNKVTGEHHRTRQIIERIRRATVAVDPETRMVVKNPKTRESWLMDVAKGMEPWFEEVGYPVGKYRVTMGMGPDTSYYGWCWHRSMSSDGAAEIFINACMSNEKEIAATLCHEMIHAALPDGEGHSVRFKKIAEAFGIAHVSEKGRLTKYVPHGRKRTAFNARIAPILKAAGAYPGVRMKPGKHTHFAILPE